MTIKDFYMINPAIKELANEHRAFKKEYFENHARNMKRAGIDPVSDEYLNHILPEAEEMFERNYEKDNASPTVVAYRVEQNWEDIRDACSPFKLSIKAELVKGLKPIEIDSLIQHVEWLVIDETATHVVKEALKDRLYRYESINIAVEVIEALEYQYKVRSREERYERKRKIRGEHLSIVFKQHCFGAPVITVFKNPEFRDLPNAEKRMHALKQALRDSHLADLGAMFEDCYIVNHYDLRECEKIYKHYVLNTIRYMRIYKDTPLEYLKDLCERCKYGLDDIINDEVEEFWKDI